MKLEVKNIDGKLYVVVYPKHIAAVHTKLVANSDKSIERYVEQKDGYLYLGPQIRLLRPNSYKTSSST